MGGNTALTTSYIPFHCAGTVSSAGSVSFSFGFARKLTHILL
jgi:hypothetical protein